MTGQPFVDECVVGRQEVDDVAVFADDARRRNSVSLECLPEVVVEIRKLVLIRRRALQVAQIQPLTGEVTSASDLGLASMRLPADQVAGIAIALAGQVQQLIVRNAAPEKERAGASSRSLMRYTARAPGWIGHARAKDELGARRHAAKNKFDTAFEGPACRPA